VAGDRHSRVVAATKVLLPLVALGILSTLFLVAKRIDTEAAIPFATVDVRELAREARIGAPRYAGMTADGAAVTITASRALPGDADLSTLRAEQMVAQIDMADGTILGLTAPRGRLDTPAGLAELTGGVVVTLSTGWRAETAALETALDATRVLAETRIDATGPLGDITAGRMELTQPGEAAPSDGTGDHRGPVLLFTQGVRLLYDPRR
jgi:lipopolysaccharide export system protein LptC